MDWLSVTMPYLIGAARCFLDAKSPGLPSTGAKYYTSRINFVPAGKLNS